MLVRQSGWSASPDTWLATIRRWLTSGGWKDRASPTGTAIGYRYISRTVEQTWRRDRLRPTNRRRMALYWELSENPPVGELQTYNISFPNKSGPWDWPVKWCKGRAAERKGLHVHFLHWHIWETVVILEEENPSHPWCTCYDMLVPWDSLKGRHPNTDQCPKGVEQKWRRLSAEEI